MSFVYPSKARASACDGKVVDEGRKEEDIYGNDRREKITKQNLEYDLALEKRRHYWEEVSGG